MKRRLPPRADSDLDAVHRAMLEHLTHNPPRKRPSEPADPPLTGRTRPKPKKKARPLDPPRPRLMLRMLRCSAALVKLEQFVRFHCAKGTPEIVAVVGKGQRSGDAGPVIGPAVRRWCEEHPTMVTQWQPASPREGGEGALILRLRPRG